MALPEGRILRTLSPLAQQLSFLTAFFKKCISFFLHTFDDIGIRRVNFTYAAVKMHFYSGQMH